MGTPFGFTVGYSGRSVDELAALLTGRGVERVVDVRALPLSRRRGFSKTALSIALARHGIEYVHLRDAGNPFRHLRADVARCLAMYRAHLANRPDVVDSVAAVLRERPSALLCVEADACDCHRSILAEALRRRDRRRRFVDL